MVILEPSYSLVRLNTWQAARETLLPKIGRTTGLVAT